MNWRLSPYRVPSLSRWTKKRRAFLKARDYYGEELEMVKGPYVLRKEEGKVRDILKEIKDWMIQPQKTLMLTGEGGCGKSRSCIEIAREKEMRWIPWGGDLSRVSEEDFVEGMVYVFEDYEENRSHFPQFLELFQRKKGKLLILSRGTDSLRVELERRGEIPQEIHFKKMENLLEIFPPHGRRNLSEIGKISEGNPGIAILAWEFCRMRGNLSGIGEREDLLNAIYKETEKRIPDSLPLLGKMALLRGMEVNFYKKIKGKIQKGMVAGKILRRGNLFQIVPTILNDYIAKRFFFIPFDRDCLETTIEEFMPTRSKEMITTMIHLMNREGCKIILEKSRGVDARTAIHLGFLAYDGFHDMDLIERSLGDFWNRVWELDTPEDYMEIASLLSQNLSRWEEAEKCWEKSLSLFEKEGNERGVIEASNHLAGANRRKGDFAKVREYYEKSLETAKKSGNLKVTADQSFALGSLSLHSENFKMAREYYEKSLSAYEELRDHPGRAQATGSLALACKREGNIENAILYYEKSLEIYESLEDFHGMAETYYHLAITTRESGEWERAIAYYEKYISVALKLGDFGEVAQSYDKIARLYWSHGNPVRALESYELNLQMRERMGDLQGVSQTFRQMASIHFSQGNWEKTILAYEKSLLLKERLEDFQGMARIYNNLGIAWLRMGGLENALKYFEKSLSIKEKLEDLQGMAKTFNNLGNIYGKLGNYEKAVQFYKKDLSISEKMGDFIGLAQTRGNLGILFMEQGLLEEAEPLLLNSLSTFKTHGDRSDSVLALEALEKLFKSYRRRGDSFGMRRVEIAISDYPLEVEE